MCSVRDFNLSYASLTSFPARERLRKLKETDPEFWTELTTSKEKEPVETGENVAEDDMEAETAAFDDDSDVPITALVDFVVSGQPKEGVKVQEGGLRSAAAVEAVDYEDERPSWAEEVGAGEDSHRAPGKRKVTANRKYTGTQFWTH